MPIRRLALALLVFALGGCAENDAAERAGGSGGVLLTINDLGTEIPFRVSVNDNTALQFPTITITNIPANPAGVTSDLMDVHLEYLEATYTRGDTGTRVPAPFVYRLTGTVPINGQTTLNNYPVASFEQMRNAPIADLLFENGGFDRETGATFIRIYVQVRVFGRTRAGDPVVTPPITEMIEFVQ